MNLETVSEKLRSEEITPEILNFLSGKGLEKLLAEFPATNGNKDKMFKVS